MIVELEVPAKGYGLNVKQVIKKLQIVRSRGGNDIVKISIIDNKLTFEVK